MGKKIRIKPGDELEIDASDIMFKRKVETETEKTVTGKRSNAMSSTEQLFYHDIPPELIKRLAKRYTVGHKKYSGDVTMNLNWRSGLHDPFYCMDRLNHVIEHLMNFLEDGDVRDDNLGAIVWGCAYLMEVERLYPDVLTQVVGQMQLHGKHAADKLLELKKAQNEDN